MAKYSVYVNKYRPKEYGAADFYLGKARTLTEAKQMIKKNTRNGDSYCISYGNAAYYKRENQCRTGTVYGSGRMKICKDGYKHGFFRTHQSNRLNQESLPLFDSLKNTQCLFRRTLYSRTSAHLKISVYLGKPICN